MGRKHRTTTKQKRNQKRKHRTTIRNRIKTEKNKIKSDVTPIVAVVDSNPNEYQDFSEIQDINALKDGKTPLYEAVIDNKPALVEQLLAVPGIDVNKHSTTNEITPLYSAIFMGYNEVVRVLLTAPGIDVNEAVLNDKITPLYLAVQLNNPEIVEMLLAAPVINVNKTTKDGETPLIHAAARGYSDIVQMLLVAPGIDIYHADNDNYTAHSIALKGGHTDIVNAIDAIVRKQRIAFELLNYDAPINSKRGLSRLPRNVRDLIFSFPPPQVKGGKKSRKIKRTRY